MLLQVDLEEIQKISLKYLIYLLYEAEVLAASERIIPVLISILNYHADCLEVQAQVCRIFLMFAIKATEDSVEEGILFSENVISIILSIMASRHKCVELQQVLCNFLMLLSGSDENAQIARSENMLQTILQVLEKHIQNGDVVESASAALWVLSLQEPLNDEQLEDITLLLIEALDLHLRKEIIVKNICFALSSLIRLSELVAFRILVPEDHLDGLALIVQSYHIHFTDPEVVQDICMVFQEMVQYKDVVPELISQKLDVTLNAIKVKFASNEDIVTVLDSTLSKLQAAEAGAQNEDSRNTKDSI
ncbi:hypothetical protein chiPu_0018214 [Chiloscyllium punctatum]|uniref:Uncharacterized protein n=1 Tax=Chiloscyllium punctatum TaxID=137246 RepID=A0A401RLS3_CHIPU|nr:hypothetical protein [Chiloscyllium punctatum]